MISLPLVVDALCGSVYKDVSRYSVIHADLDPGNVLVNGETLTVIDFDDTAWG